MQIPSHEPVGAERMAEALREALKRRRRARAMLVRDAVLHPEVGDYRWTRVPFLKVVLAGRMWLTEDETSGREGAWLGAGDAVLFAAGSHVNLRLVEPVRFFRVTFDVGLTLFGDTVQELPDRKVRGKPAQVPLERLLAHVRPGARPLLVEELLAAWGRRGDRGGETHAWVDALLWSLLELLEEPAAVVAADDQRWREIRHYIEEQCGRPLTREGVAKTFGMSGGHLARVFRRHGKEGFQATLLKLRLERARDLLRHSALNVEEVGLRCGFTSANYFAQAFRRIEGRPPRAWRLRA